MQSLANSIFGGLFSQVEEKKRSSSSRRATKRSSSRKSKSRTRPRSRSRARSSSSGRTIINVTLKPGGLSDWGYDSNDSASVRHKALMRAVKSEGYRPIIGRLNLLSVYNKNRSPHYSRIFKSDQRWLSAKYEVAKERTASR